jgi:two-component system nitrate/nitrite response regulator NarL
MNIFLVEDSLRIRTLLLCAIESLSGALVVGEAECEEMAIALILHSQPDLVLLDLQLAFNGSGLNVLQRLRREGFAGKIFMMTNQVHDTYRRVARELGADRFYDKALDMARLIDDLSGMAAGAQTGAGAVLDPA